MMLRTRMSRRSPKPTRSIDSSGVFVLLVLIGILHLFSLVNAAPMSTFKAVTGTSDEVAQIPDMGVSGSRVTEGTRSADSALMGQEFGKGVGMEKGSTNFDSLFNQGPPLRSGQTESPPGLERLKGVKSYKQDHNPTDISLQRDTAKVVKDVGSPETFSEANTFQRTKGYRYSSNEVLTDTKDMRGLVKEYDTNGQRLLTPAVTQARETRFAGKVKLFSPATWKNLRSKLVSKLKKMGSKPAKVKPFSGTAESWKASLESAEKSVPKRAYTSSADRLGLKTFVSSRLPIIPE